MSRKAVAFLSALAAVMMISAVSAPGLKAQEAQPGTIVDIAVANGNFTTLVAAAQAAGLADDLAGPGPFTVFAPTDRAFQALLNRLGISAGTLLADKALLTEVLLYHVVAGELTADEVLVLNELEMLNGDLATISVRSGAAYINNSRIVITDIQASNGVIHVIDTVLLPSGVTAPPPYTANIVDIALENEGFSTLVAALVAADLVDTLSGPGPFTVFAPSNDAFNKTLSELDLTLADVVSNRALLTEILLYHVAVGSYDAQDVLGMGQIRMLNGDTAQVSVRGGVVYINDASVSRANIVTSNGIIHVIDAVLIPPAE